MKAVILAAGPGSRLNDSSAALPKCLVEVGGLSLLQRQIRILHQLGIHDIIIVGGFHIEALIEAAGEQAEILLNPVYEKTRNLYSLWVARNYIRDGFLTINGDVLFHSAILENLLSARFDDALLVSSSEQPMGDEEVKVVIRQGKVIDIGKELDPAAADAESLGIAKFGPQGAKVLLDCFDHLLPAAENAHLPLAFREFLKQRPFAAVDTRGLPWIEIDFPQDYEKARKVIYPLLDK